MPHGTDCPYPIRIFDFFEMIRPYHVGIRIGGKSREMIVGICLKKKSFVVDITSFILPNFRQTCSTGISIGNRLVQILFPKTVRVSTSYLIRDGGSLLGPTRSR